MSNTIVGILGLLTIIAIVVTLFQSKTQPAIAFIVWPTILALILVVTGRYTFDNIAAMIKSGFGSTGPTAALFVFSVLYFGIMTDAGMFDVIIGKLMTFVGDNVIVVCIVTCIIALVGHLDGGGASTFCIVVPAMMPVFDRMHMRRTSLLRIAVLAMGVLNLMPWAGPTMRAASVLGIEAGSLWQTILPIQVFGIILALAHAVLTGFQEKARGAGLHGKLAQEEGAVEVTAAEAAARENARRIAEAKAREEKAKAEARAAARKSAEEKARAERAARAAEKARLEAERKAAAENRAREREVAEAKKSAEPTYTLSTVDRQLSGSFESNRGRLPMPIVGGYQIVHHFGTNSVTDVKGHVTLDKKGIDIKGQPGASVRSIFDGEVSAVFGYAGTTVVIIRHGNYLSVYCDLASVSVSRGQKVSARQNIGRLGSDGTMQFQLRKGAAKLNPESWLAR